MKLIKKTLLTLTLLIGFNPLYAGGGHSHDLPSLINKTTVKTIAKNEISRLARANSIDKTWLNKDLTKIEKYKQGSEWRVIFKNNKLKDVKKQTLYVFVTNTGRLAGVNYTGK